MRAQMEQTFQNLDRCLKALGVANPISTTVGVTRLAGPNFMIEIEAVAVVNS